MKRFFLCYVFAPLVFAQSSEPVSQPTTDRAVSQPATQPAELSLEQVFSRRSQKLFILSGVTGGLGLALGASALGSSRSATELLESQSPEADEIVRHRKKAVIRSSLSGLLLATSIASVGVAFLAPRETAQVSISLGGLSLQVSF